MFINTQTIVAIVASVGSIIVASAQDISEVLMSESIGQDNWNMCAAYDTVDISRTYFAPCLKKNAVPPLGVYGHILHDVGLVDGGTSNYLTNSSLFDSLGTPVNDTVAAQEGILTMDNDGEVGFRSVSLVFGNGDTLDTTTLGGYLGTTSYIVTKGSGKTKTNQVEIGDTYYNVTVDEVTYGPGMYKFSVFFACFGQNFSNIAAQLGFADKQFVFKTLLTPTFCPDGGCQWTVTVQSTSSDSFTAMKVNESVVGVKTIRVKATNTDNSLNWDMNIAYPQTFRYGTFDGSETFVDEGSDKVVTNAKMVEMDGSIVVAIDYVFPMKYLTAEYKYIIYDPEVTALQDKDAVLSGSSLPLLSIATIVATVSFGLL